MNYYVGKVYVVSICSPARLCASKIISSTAELPGPKMLPDHLDAREGSTLLFSAVFESFSLSPRSDDPFGVRSGRLPRALEEGVSFFGVGAGEEGRLEDITICD